MTPAEIEHWRLFVALPVPEDVKVAIQRTQAAIRQRLPNAGISWTRPEQFHLTLKFLGDVPAQSVPALIAALRLVAADFRPLALQSRGLGFFPSARAPRVLWAGITDLSGQLNRLQERAERACTDFTTETVESRFHAHVTLARVKRFARGLPEAAAPGLNQEFGAWTATNVELIRSQLASEGPNYTSVANLTLSKA